MKHIKIMTTARGESCENMITRLDCRMDRVILLADDEFGADALLGENPIAVPVGVTRRRLFVAVSLRRARSCRRWG
jgi:hypothetical protein